MVGRSSWYKNKKNTSLDDGNGMKRGGGRKYPGASHGKQDLKTRAVLFIEQTPNGELVRQIKELLVRLEPVLGFRLRVVERTGRSIQSLLPQASIWKGSPCDRGMRTCQTALSPALCMKVYAPLAIQEQWRREP